jgi:hypothetical protein
MLRSLFSTLLLLLSLILLVRSECKLHDLDIDAALGDDIEEVMDIAIDTLVPEHAEDIALVTTEDIAKGFTKREKFGLKLLKKYNKKRMTKGNLRTQGRVLKILDEMFSNAAILDV